MIFKYVLTGNGEKAMPVHSERTYAELEAFIRKNCKQEDGETVFIFGTSKFVNPKIKLPGEFVESTPAIL